MSMRHYPTSAWVLPLSEVADKYLTPDQIDHITELEEEATSPTEEIYNFLKPILPDWFPEFDIYIPSEEDYLDEDMEIGEVYLLFSESSLFVKRRTPVMSKLVSDDVGPFYARWATFG